MSGCFSSTGKLTNRGQKDLVLGNLEYTRINNIVIHAVPLSNNWATSLFRYEGKRISAILHPSLTFTLSHIAIQLNMENNDILLIEYGQYLSKDSEIKPGFLSSSGSKSSGNPRTETNKNSYYYINKDGARITKINKEKYFNGTSNEKNYEIISKLIASEQYGIPYEEFNFNFITVFHSSIQQSFS